MKKILYRDGNKYQNIGVDNHIIRRFEIDRRVGEGGFGIVWKATDKKTNEVVALKKVFGAFRNSFFAQTTYREIAYLQAFRKHANIIRLYSLHRSANDLDIYLGFEFMETDLEHAIFKGVLDDVHKKYIMYQILSATKYIHSGNVIHRDQKPSNILLDNTCRAKLADFGLARSVNYRQGSDKEMEVMPTHTGNMGTRWYKAPEVLSGSHEYTTSVDMWSLGCILAEMIRGQALFKGSSGDNQIEKILTALYVPKKDDIRHMHLGKESKRVYKDITQGQSLRSIMRGYPRDVSDLIRKLLVLNPKHRLTAAEAMNHRYVKRLKVDRKCCDMVMHHDVLPPVSDDIELSMEGYREKLYELINDGPPRPSAGKNKRRRRHRPRPKDQQTPGKQTDQQTKDQTTTPADHKLRARKLRKMRLANASKLHKAPISKILHEHSIQHSECNPVSSRKNINSKHRTVTTHTNQTSLMNNKPNPSTKLEISQKHGECVDTKKPETKGTLNTGNNSIKNVPSNNA